ncbi:MAG: Asp-tRNA(Asn)/Glu-tRNA(Gln) amidotransferase subunit GatB [Candidatus Falkowbacteria bacterium]
MKYDVIIGLEIHAELKTKSKMFCSCNNNSEGKAANTVVCPICLGHPGTLPRPNQKAIEDTILIGLAINGDINQISKFDRKNYFYPDLPKGYQISQYDLPLVYNGVLEFDDQKIPITRIHLEEDTGKLSHPAGTDYTLIDFNRAGTPLVELVTEPLIPDAATAKKFCQKYQQILRYLDVSDADMEKGQMRCEANISIQTPGSWQYIDGRIDPVGDAILNPKVEVKNINSFRSLEKAINYEVVRQTKAIADDEKLWQETRGWDDNKNCTVRQRIKESSADYRYFSEPDIPPIIISDELLENLRSKLSELPEAKKTRFIHEYELREEIAEILINDKELSEWYENVISELNAWIISQGDSFVRQEQKLSTLAGNWITSELLKYDSAARPSAGDFAKLILMLYENKINSSAGQTILKAMVETKKDPSDLMTELNLEQMGGGDELEAIVKNVIDSNPEQVATYKSGKTGIFQYFVGQTMAKTKGKANPTIVADLLKKYLD